MINTKNFTSLFGIFLIIMSIGLVSADTSFSLSTTTASFDEADEVQTLTLTNTGTDTINITLPSATAITEGSDTVTFTFSSSNELTLAPSESLPINISITGDPSIFSLGTRTATATVSAVNSTNSTITDLADVTLELVSGFCSDGEKGDLEIRKVSIENFDSDDDQWRLLNEIEVKVEVKNIGTNDIDDVFVEIGLYNSDGENVADDLDFESGDEEIDLGNFDEDDRETATFNFKVPADLEEGDYKLVVKAFSDDEGESNICVHTSSDLSQNIYHEISVERETDEDRFIAFDDIELTPQEATCGDTVRLRTDVLNIGDEDQDQVLVTLFNDELGVETTQEIRSDLNVGDSDDVTFDFTVPEDAEDGSYTFFLTADYGYDNDDDVYEDSLDEPEEITLEVIGCDIQSADSVAVTASLASEAKAGEELSVDVTVTNLQNSETDIILSPLNYESWANLGSVSERIFTLAGGESKTVSIKFNVDEDASGEQRFTVETRVNGESKTREVAVNIAEAQSQGGLSNFQSILEGNTLLWILGIINVILIILVIIVAIRLSTR